MKDHIRSFLAAFLLLCTTSSYSGFSHTIELEGDVIHIILTANFWLGAGHCPEPIINWVVTDDSLHLNVLHLWHGITAYASCTRTDTVSITPSPFFDMPCKLLIEQTWFWGSTLQLHSLEEEDLCTVDVSEHVGKPQLGIHPNPASDHIWLSGMLPGQQLEVFDAAGRSVQKESVAGDPHRLDIHGLRSGLYVVRMTDHNGMFGTQRLIVE